MLAAQMYFIYSDTGSQTSIYAFHVQRMCHCCVKQRSFEFEKETNSQQKILIMNGMALGIC